MVSMNMCLIATGDDFSPSALEITMGIRFAKKHEKGELGATGRYKGIEYPSGSCIVEMESNDDLIEFIESNMPILINAGITEMVFDISVEYSEQCNFDFTPDWLARISKLNIPVAISCYKVGNNAG